MACRTLKPTTQGASVAGFQGQRPQPGHEEWEGSQQL